MKSLGSQLIVICRDRCRIFACETHVGLMAIDWVMHDIWVLSGLSTSLQYGARINMKTNSQAKRYTVNIRIFGGRNNQSDRECRKIDIVNAMNKTPTIIIRNTLPHVISLDFRHHLPLWVPMRPGTGAQSPQRACRFARAYGSRAPIMSIIIKCALRLRLPDSELNATSRLGAKHKETVTSYG